MCLCSLALYFLVTHQVDFLFILSLTNDVTSLTLSFPPFSGYMPIPVPDRDGQALLMLLSH